MPIINEKRLKQNLLSILYCAARELLRLGVPKNEILQEIDDAEHTYVNEAWVDVEDAKEAT